MISPRLGGMEIPFEVRYVLKETAQIGMSDCVAQTIRHYPGRFVETCTGTAATARLWESFPGRCATPGVGQKFVFKM